MNSLSAVLFLAAWALGLASQPLFPIYTRAECVMSAAMLTWAGFVAVHTPQTLAATGLDDASAMLTCLSAVVLGALAGTQAWIELRAEIGKPI
jgi:hypothetical protein